MSSGASADDLEEIAEGKASARDMAEAGVSSIREAQRLLRKHGVKVHTTHKKQPAPKRKRRKS